MEYRRKCKVCGHIWCYTDQDLKENQTNSAMTAVSAIGQIASAFGGNIFQQAYLNNQTDKLKNKIVDYNKCPQCNSLSTELINDEEWKQLNKKQSQGTTVQQIKTIQISSNATPESLINRATVFLEDLEWEKADAYAEACLDIEPQNASAYLIKLLAELQVPTKEKLSKCKYSFEDNALYKKVLRYGDSELVSELKNYINTINVRNQKAEQKRIYDEAKSLMEQKNITSYNLAIKKFNTLLGWRDSFELILQCKHCIEEINLKNEQERVAKEKAAKEKKKKTIIALSSIAAVAVATIIIVIISNYIKYKPLSDAFDNNKVTVEYIQNNHSNLQYDKGALQVFEKELEECHKQNDLKHALEILIILAESDVVFDYVQYDETGNNGTYFNPHISAWFSFTEWIYAQVKSDGQKIQTEDYDGYVDETYEVYGHKLSIKKSNVGRIYEVDVFVPSIGWYEVSASEKNASNRIFHSKKGGIMVD